jgi:Alpha/beta hydrolase family
MPNTIDIRRPALTLLGTEPYRAGFEYVLHALTKAPRRADGDGHPVVIFPGLASNGRAVAPLRRYCNALGYRAMDWGCGFNTGPRSDLETWLRELAEHTAQVMAPFGNSATLIGWSLGGLYAREVAKLMPTRVRQVITIGSPFNAERDHSNVGWAYRLFKRGGPRLDATLSARLRTAPDVPTTSIFSRSDGVVAWQTCTHDGVSDRVEDIEVRGSHIGMGWNPAVLKVIADRLAQRPGRWVPYATSQSGMRYAAPQQT